MAAPSARPCSSFSVPPSQTSWLEPERHISSSCVGKSSVIQREPSQRIADPAATIQVFVRDWLQIAGVWSQSRTNTWIVAAGSAMRWDGSRWITLDLPTQDELMCLSGSSQDVWLGGTLKLLHGR